MVLMMTWAALAGQPGENANVYGLAVEGASEIDRTVPVAVAVHATVQADKNWYATASAQARPGIENETIVVLNSISGLPLGTPPPSSGGTEFVYRLAIGGHIDMTARTPGLRAGGGILTTIHDGHQASNFMERVYATIPDYHSSQLGGLEAEVGWASPIGDDIGDPLLVMSLRVSGEAPMAAWGAGLSEFRREILNATGVRTTRGLVPPRADTQVRAVLTMGHFRGSLVVGQHWRMRSAAFRRSLVVAQGSPTIRFDPQLSASAGVVF